MASLGLNELSEIQKYLVSPQWVDTLRPRQNGRHFADDIFKYIFLQYSSIGLDNGLVPNRQQTIIWTNGDLISDAYMRHSATMS